MNLIGKILFFLIKLWQPECQNLTFLVPEEKK